MTILCSLQRATAKPPLSGKEVRWGSKDLGSSRSGKEVRWGSKDLGSSRSGKEVRWGSKDLGSSRSGKEVRWGSKDLGSSRRPVTVQYLNRSPDHVRAATCVLARMVVPLTSNSQERAVFRG